jgi:hypothetical protein
MYQITGRRARKLFKAQVAGCKINRWEMGEVETTDGRWKTASLGRWEHRMDNADNKGLPSGGVAALR